MCGFYRLYGGGGGIWEELEEKSCFKEQSQPIQVLFWASMFVWGRVYGLSRNSMGGGVSIGSAEGI